MITFAHIASTLIAAVVAVSVGVGASAYVLRDTTYSSVAEDTSQQTDLMQVESVSLPKQLIIPTIRIDTMIEMVGRTSEGAMESPSNSRDVAWYKEGARPGEEGSAVIAGHLDNVLGMSGIFKDLDTLAVGSYVYVQTASGERKRFRVIRIAEYRYDEVPTQELFDRSDGIYLNLITCSGEWLQEHKTYDHRFIIYTELAPIGYSSERRYNVVR